MSEVKNEISEATVTASPMRDTSTNQSNSNFNLFNNLGSGSSGTFRKNLNFTFSLDTPSVSSGTLDKYLTTVLGQDSINSIPDLLVRRAAENANNNPSMPQQAGPVSELDQAIKKRRAENEAAVLASVDTTSHPTSSSSSTSYNSIQPQSQPQQQQQQLQKQQQQQQAQPDSSQFIQAYPCEPVNTSPSQNNNHNMNNNNHNINNNVNNNNNHNNNMTSSENQQMISQASDNVNNNKQILGPEQGAIQLHGRSQWIDITEYLSIPQAEAARRLNIPPSTLSKRWKEAVAKQRKWPYRMVCKIDKEIMTLLHNVPQGPNAPPLPPEIEQALGVLLRKRQEELRPVIIRL